ncbi:glycoside hydrolase family 99-like domain-containing protein [Hyphomonas johnsonii]|nr:glycoside hydrolase family 99-like domain-containing protein [Hyphomonas johnsonii]
MNQARRIDMIARRILSGTARTLWRAVPLSSAAKDHVMGHVFRRAPILVSWSVTYRNWKLEEDRLRHYLANLKAVPANSVGGSAYRELSALGRPAKLAARAIAFYLPQFHPIEENDRWWGKGFTEWTNVRRARPQFEGHNQPRRPSELGYYDLLKNPAIRRRQARLADQYGLGGFCFYFYWFAGKRLLEAPVEAYATDDEITFPFCLCWANENWSRRWDGREDDVLMAQAHSEDDDLAFIAHLATYLKNPKYIRIGNRPLLLVYRPGLLPDARATADRWREWCRRNGIGEIYLAYTQSFETVDPSEYGFDAAIEFPPNNLGLEPVENLVEPVSDAFACHIYDWSKLVERSADYPEVPYRLFRGVTPQWDNTARRMNQSAILWGSSPGQYELWLRRAAAQVTQDFRDAQERLVFINAWNEWAEGAYLEPDAQNGYAWLDATRRALLPPKVQERVEPAQLVPLEPTVQATRARKIIIVVHDLHRHGAQYLALSFAAMLRQQFGYEIITVACGEGELGSNFSVYGRLIQLNQKARSPERVRALLNELHDQGFEKAIVNSAASGWISPYLAEVGIAFVGLVHEMPVIIETMKLQPAIKAMDAHARRVIFAADMVRDQTADKILGSPWQRALIAPQGLYKREGIARLADKETAREKLCKQMNLPGTSVFVIGVGYGDYRKGVDIFCHWAVAAARENPDLHFVWIGDLSQEMRSVCDDILRDALDIASHVHLPGFRADTSLYYTAASAYALTSREDPYPSTALEAFDAGTPVLMIAGTGGIEDLSSSGAVTALPDASAGNFAEALQILLAAETAGAGPAQQALEMVRAKFGFQSFVGDVLRELGEPCPKVSVIVPNYNYARHLPHRLSTILSQSLPVWEIIFLDDASSDDSLHVAQQMLQNSPVRYRIISNDTNSGSVFAQWQKGVDLAEGDIVWIAEADDWAAREFVESAASAFSDSDVVLSYTQSNQVNEQGEIMCPHYLDYVSDVDAERWRRPFVNEGREELAEGLSVKNTIPNVSSVLFRRDALRRVLTAQMDDISTYRVAGDWCVYMHLAQLGRIAFDPRPLNYHRRHTESVTISRFGKAEWDEVKRMQDAVAAQVDLTDDIRAVAQHYLLTLSQRLEDEPT